MITSQQKIILNNYGKVNLADFCNAESDLPQIKKNIVINTAISNSGDPCIGSSYTNAEEVTYSIYPSKIKQRNARLYSALENPQITPDLGTAEIRSVDQITGQSISLNAKRVIITKPIAVPSNSDKPVDLTLKFFF